MASLGDHLGVDACVVMGHYQASDTLLYAGWYGRDDPFLGQRVPRS
ncbi:MAG TPA: hypothetical protein IGR64_13485, partial [Leptolyngbyaceae cyanobacterium M65_K2018_010]|nr:hypothetical protein [Leptolyngbyaceae cyanobacterium M65_K2018_010]